MKEVLDDRIMELISVNRKIRFGKPCIAGTRITIRDVLEIIDAGLSFQDIMRDYSRDIQVEDIRACLCYADP